MNSRDTFVGILLAVLGLTAAVPLPAAEKNWTAPPTKIFVQALTEEVMGKHPELISITFHGAPPGAAPKTYTMFGGSYLDRIGNADDPDDIMIIETGITILDPRWHRTKDPLPKFVVMAPLRDAAGDNIGLLVMAFHNGPHSGKTDLDFFRAGTTLRDSLSKKISALARYLSPQSNPRR